MAKRKANSKVWINRRRFLSGLGGFLTLPMVAGSAFGRETAPILKKIPGHDELIPAIGMGTWITFNVGNSETLRRQRLAVLKHFLARGGGMIDSSPMYGSSEEVIGWCLKQLDNRHQMVSATKVWTPYGGETLEEVNRSAKLWGLSGFDVMQIHNLVDWEKHLENLLAEKAAGRIRYVGVTTSHGARHSALERIMTTKPIDFVQFTYNMVDRAAENRLLPLATERNLGVIINRPFRQKQLFKLFANNPLPAFATEFDCQNWAQFFLKFIISHPAVTCAIPATSRRDHMDENMGALYGRLPDQKLRRKMISYIDGL